MERIVFPSSSYASGRVRGPRSTHLRAYFGELGADIVALARGGREDEGEHSEGGEQT